MPNAEWEEERRQLEAQVGRLEGKVTPAALRQLLELMQGPIERCCKGWFDEEQLPYSEDLEDVLQEVMLSVWRKFRKLRGGMDAGYYIGMTLAFAKNSVGDVYRRVTSLRRRERGTISESKVALGGCNDDEGVDGNGGGWAAILKAKPEVRGPLEQDEINAAFTKCLNELDTVERIVMHAKRDGKVLKEVGKRLRLASPQISERLKQAMKKMFKCMRKEKIEL